MPHPLVNITIPVFNRLQDTLKTLTALKKYTHSPHLVTVVDNGSEPAVHKALCEAKNNGLIDHLFVLDNNYGISCAVNTGWSLVPAACYMKLDNDIEALQDNWLLSLMQRWQHREPFSILGPFWKENMPGRAGARLDSPNGPLWEARKSLPGAALMVPAPVLEQIGFLNEDYGLYGAEDADYCERALAGGCALYAFEAEGLLLHLGVGSTVYQEHGINKMHLVKKYAGTAESMGLYKANAFLFATGLRSVKVPLKYRVETVEGKRVKVGINREYLSFRSRLLACMKFMDHIVREHGAEHMQHELVLHKLAELLRTAIN